MKEEHIPYGFEKCSSAEVEAKAGALLNSMQKRRSLRFFSEEDVSKQTIADLLNVASSRLQVPINSRGLLLPFQMLN